MSYAFTTRTDAISQYIEPALGDFAEDYDMNGIFEDVFGWNDLLQCFRLMVDEYGFWEAADAHDVSDISKVIKELHESISRDIKDRHPRRIEYYPVAYAVMDMEPITVSINNDRGDLQVLAYGPEYANEDGDYGKLLTIDEAIRDTRDQLSLGKDRIMCDQIKKSCDNKFIRTGEGPNDFTWAENDYHRKFNPAIDLSEDAFEDVIQIMNTRLYLNHYVSTRVLYVDTVINSSFLTYEEAKNYKEHRQDKGELSSRAYILSYEIVPGTLLYRLLKAVDPLHK